MVRSKPAYLLALLLIMLAVAAGVPSDAKVPAVTAMPDVPAADAWRDAAQTGAPLTLRWQDHTFQVVVAVNDKVDPSGYDIVDLDGTAIDASHITALAGHIVGEPRSNVRITLNGDLIDGMILSDTFGHLGLSTADGQTRVALPSEADPDGSILPEYIDEDPEVPAGGTCGAPAYVLAGAAGLVTGWTPRTIDMAFAVDNAYAAGIAGGDWLGATLALANRLDGFYDDAADLRIGVVHVIRVGATPSTTNAALAQTANHYDANYPTLHRDAVYLMSGVDFTNALGQASCIGGAGPGGNHYVTGNMLFEQNSAIQIGPFRIYGDASLKTIAHELGHQLNGRHEQHNCVELITGLNPNQPADACTTMAPFVDFHGVGFSTWVRLTVRGYADLRNL